MPETTWCTAALHLAKQDTTDTLTPDEHAAEERVKQTGTKHRHPLAKSIK